MQEVFSCKFCGKVLFVVNEQDFPSDCGCKAMQELFKKIKDHAAESPDCYEKLVRENDPKQKVTCQK